MNAIPYIIQGKNIVVIIGNKPHTITESNIGYTALKQAIKDGDWDAVPDLVTPAKAIKTYAKGHFDFEDGILYEEGVRVSSAIADRMFVMYEEGFSVDPLIAFYKNIKANPSTQSAAELYGFLEKNSLPITEDGCFIAYKRVHSNYTDVRTGTMDNSIGKIVSMERQMVNDDRNKTCSSGLHFCSYSYLKEFSGDRVVTLKINPVDVVSIPTDYDNAKGRCCKYEVIGELTLDEALNDALADVSVYQETVIVHSDEDEPVGLDDDRVTNEDEIEIDADEMYDVKSLGLRQQAKIWNELTGGNLKKFSYREDVDRRMYAGQFTDAQILTVAQKLGLI